LKKCTEMHGFLQVIPGKGVRRGQSGVAMGSDQSMGDTFPEMPEKGLFRICTDVSWFPAGASGTMCAAWSEIFMRGYIKYTHVAVQQQSRGIV